MWKSIQKLKNAPYAASALGTVGAFSIVDGVKAEVGEGLSTDTEGGAGTLAENLGGQAGDWRYLFVVVAYILGFAFLIMAFFKFRKAKETDGQQVSMGNALVTGVVGIGLIALPSVAGFGAATFGLEETGSDSFGQF